MTDIAIRAEQYVKLRDLIKAKEAAHKKDLAKPKETLEKLNSLLLDHLNSIGANSVATDGGTVYRTEKKTASLADPEAFMNYVIENMAYDLLDRKANVTAVAEYIKDNASLPPGVNFQTHYVAGVRRPKQEKDEE